MVRHKGISKARWLSSQKHFSEIWRREDVLAKEQARRERLYLPLLQRHQAEIGAATRILELCCGPVCIARLIDKGERTYLDPMLDAYRRMYPGKLPKGRHLALAAEKIPEDTHSFDIILCINGLDQMLNPELVLNEIERLLKPSGTLLVGMPVFPALLVRLRYFCERFFRPLRDESHPYSYSLPAFRRSLARHFDIVEELRLDEASAIESRLLGSEYAFVCRHKSGE
jgi:ubiquinone/menaquinone biosynthesis C-methylase UbiE